MSILRNSIFVLLAGLILLSIGSCQKQLNYSQEDLVYFSVDTLHFDTAFTSTTTATRRVKLFNRSSKSVRVNRLYLDGGASSYFRLGIDAQTGYEATDVTILPYDSSYVFVSVTIDPNSDSLSFIVSDQIVAETDAGMQRCVVDAYGQNAIFFKDTVLSTMRWTADLPVVLLGHVEVAEGETLTIDPGTRIYTQAQKYLFVSGTLIAQGTKEDSIIFQGNRLDRDYFRYGDNPGEWGGIYFTPSSVANELRHVIIKNASTGIWVDSLATDGDYKVKLDKSTIYNALAYGVFSYFGSIDMRNSILISNNVNLAMSKGGRLYMNHCTLGGYSVQYNQHSAAYKSVSMIALNYYIYQNIIYPADLEARIYNSIIYGSLDQEVVLDSVTSAGFYIELRNNILKTTNSENRLRQLSTVYENMILNQDPDFADTYEGDYSYPSSSPAYRSTSTYTLMDDINDRPRMTPTDRGCEEMD